MQNWIQHLDFLKICRLYEVLLCALCLINFCFPFLASLMDSSEIYWEFKHDCKICNFVSDTWDESQTSSRKDDYKKEGKETNSECINV